MLLRNENNLLAINPVVSLAGKTLLWRFRTFGRFIYKSATPALEENVGCANRSIGAGRCVVLVDYYHS